MSSRWSRLVLPAVAVTLLTPALLPTGALATGVEDQRQRVADIVDELERLEERAMVLAEDYDETLAEKAQLDQDIADAEERVAAKEAELAQLQANLGEMAIRSFVGGGPSPLGPLFDDSSALNDTMQREQLAQVALSAGSFSTDELNAVVADIEEEKQNLADKREQAEALAGQLEDELAATEQQTAEYTQARADAEAKLGQLIAEEEERRARESMERLAAQAANDAAANSNSGQSNNGQSNNGQSNSGQSNGGESDGGQSNSSGGNADAPQSSGGGGTTSAPAVSSRAGIAVNAALGQQGVPYRYASSSPGVAFDCSGLTAYAWGQAGVGLPHQSRMQYASVPHVSPSQAQPGDLIFFYSPISHVGIYLGNGAMVHAPNTGSVVNVTSVNWNNVTGVGRPG